MDEDDWLDTSPAQGSSRDPLVDQEYARLEQRYTDAGYREGITEGKLSTLQIGFDEGFASSVDPSRKLGNLRGKATAVLHLVLKHGVTTPGSPGIEGEVRELLRDLGKVRREDVLRRDIEREEHEKEHDFQLQETDSRGLEGLESAMSGTSTAAASAPSTEDAGQREAELLDSFEKRLRDLQSRIANGV